MEETVARGREGGGQKEGGEGERVLLQWTLGTFQCMRFIIDLFCLLALVQFHYSARDYKSNKALAPSPQFFCSSKPSVP